MFDASNRTENPRSFDRVFVVEDEFLIAVEICQQLTHAGFEIWGAGGVSCERVQVCWRARV
jgi:hypothetical protein